MKNLLLDNIVFSLQKSGGISIVWTNLLCELIKNNIVFKCVEYEDNINMYRENLKILPELILPQKKWGLVIKRYCSPRINLDAPSIFHSSYYRTVSHPLVKNVTTVHDFTYEYFATGPRAWIHRWQKFKAIRNSDRIVCISKNTRDDLIRFLPDISPSKITVIYNGVSDDYYPQIASHRELSDCLMFVGARGGYKNFDFAVEIAAQSRMRLLICGAPLNESEKHLLISKLGSSGYISRIRPSNKELNEYYNSVYALLYPSSYEGFGIPVLEAQKAGCPVLALNASSIPEIIGKEYPKLDRLAVSDAVSLLSVFDNATTRSEIVLNGIQNAKKYSWAKMGLEYIELYKSMK